MKACVRRLAVAARSNGVTVDNRQQTAGSIRRRPHRRLLCRRYRLRSLGQFTSSLINMSSQCHTNRDSAIQKSSSSRTTSPHYTTPEIDTPVASQQHKKIFFLATSTLLQVPVPASTSTKDSSTSTSTCTLYASTSTSTST